MWAEAEGRNYRRTILGDALVRALMAAFVAHLSGLREIAQRMGDRLGTSNFSSLSHAIGRASTLTYLKAIVEQIQVAHNPRPGALMPRFIPSLV